MSSLFMLMILSFQQTHQIFCPQSTLVWKKINRRLNLENCDGALVYNLKILNHCDDTDHSHFVPRMLAFRVGESSNLTSNISNLLNSSDPKNAALLWRWVVNDLKNCIKTNKAGCGAFKYLQVLYVPVSTSLSFSLLRFDVELFFTSFTWEKYSWISSFIDSYIETLVKIWALPKNISLMIKGGKVEWRSSTSFLPSILSKLSHFVMSAWFFASRAKPSVISILPVQFWYTILWLFDFFFIPIYSGDILIVRLSSSRTVGHTLPDKHYIP